LRNSGIEGLIPNPDGPEPKNNHASFQGERRNARKLASTKQDKKNNFNNFLPQKARISLLRN
jgi:hypothetical protein